LAHFGVILYDNDFHNDNLFSFHFLSDGVCRTMGHSICFHFNTGIPLWSRGFLSFSQIALFCPIFFKKTFCVLEEMCYNNPEPAAKKERTGTFLFEDTGGNKMEEINYQQKFEELFCTHIKREGAQQLLEWLKKTDFFSAPASTKYHCACQHGLVMHSISVFETMAEDRKSTRL